MMAIGRLESEEMEQGYHSLDSRESSLRTRTPPHCCCCCCCCCCCWRWCGAAQGSCYCYLSWIKGYCNCSKRNLNFLTLTFGGDVGVIKQCFHEIFGGGSSGGAVVVFKLVRPYKLGNQPLRSQICWPSGNKVWQILNCQSGHSFR